MRRRAAPEICREAQAGPIPRREDYGAHDLPAEGVRVPLNFHCDAARKAQYSIAAALVRWLVAPDHKLSSYIYTLI